MTEQSFEKLTAGRKRKGLEKNEPGAKLEIHEIAPEYFVDPE